MNDLLSRLDSMARHEHDDHTVAEEAAAEIRRLQAMVDGNQLEKPRQKMMIEGMTEDRLEHTIATEIHIRKMDGYPVNGVIRFITNIVYRLANTPATAPDADAEAKKLAEAVWRSNFGGNLNWAGWATCNEQTKNAWRAVAAAARGTKNEGQ